LLVCGILACSRDNPAYGRGDLVADGSGAASNTGTDGLEDGTDTRPSGGPAGGTAATSGAATDAGNEDATAGEASAGTDTDVPGGCAQGLVDGVVCHQMGELSLPEHCTARPVEVADLDGDGAAEVLVACFEGPLLRFRGSPDGPVEPAVMIGSAGAAPVDLATGPLDGDAGRDVVVVNLAGDAPVHVFLSDGAGEYTAHAYDMEVMPTRVALGDWDASGRLDIAMTLTDFDEVGILLNDGTGQFEPVASVISVEAEPVDLAMGDLDGDGRDDLAVVSLMGNALSVFINPHGGMPVADVYTEVPGAMPNRVLLNDVEPNDSVDILLSRGGVSGLRLYRGDGGGTYPLGPPDVLEFGGAMRGIDDGEFDGNDRPDAVLADRVAQVLHFVMLIEPPSNVVRAERDLPGVPWDLSAGDVDGDGITDVVVSLEDGRLVIARSGS